MSTEEFLEEIARELAKSIDYAVFGERPREIEKRFVEVLKHRLLPLLEAGQTLADEHDMSDCSCTNGATWDAARDKAMGG